MIKRLLIGFTLGAIAGAVTYKKMEDNRLPEKLLQSAQEKLDK